MGYFRLVSLFSFRMRETIFMIRCTQHKTKWNHKKELGECLPHLVLVLGTRQKRFLLNRARAPWRHILSIFFSSMMLIRRGWHVPCFFWEGGEDVHNRSSMFMFPKRFCVFTWKKLEERMMKKPKKWWKEKKRDMPFSHVHVKTPQSPFLCAPICVCFSRSKPYRQVGAVSIFISVVVIFGFCCDDCPHFHSLLSYCWGGGMLFLLFSYVYSRLVLFSVPLSLTPKQYCAQ